MAAAESELQFHGVFTFTVRDPDGTVVEQREVNRLVDIGRNELLRYLADLPRTESGQTFSGDGSTTQFQLPAPYYPIDRIYNVTVGGNSQTEHTDYSADYRTGTIYFDSPPASGTDNISVDVDYVQHPFRWLALGDDGTSVTSSDTGLGNERIRKELDPNTNSGEYTHDSSAVEVTGTWEFGGSEANFTISEAALFGMASSEAASDTSDDDPLNRTVVSPSISKSSGQVLKGTWTLSMG